MRAPVTRLAWRTVRIEQLGDAEIEELRRALGRDEDVSRLDVPVDDQVMVGVLHGRTHLPKQRSRSLQRQHRRSSQYALIAIAVDVLHDEVRQLHPA